MFGKIGQFFSRGYDGGESSRMRKDLGWGRSVAVDEDHLVGDQTRLNLRQKGMDLRRNNPPVAGVCDRIALFSIGATGIIPQCRTKDKGWNRAAEEWWTTVYSPGCDSRKRQTLQDFQWMSVAMRPTHGGLYFQKLDDGTIRPLECERLQDPQDPKGRTGYTEGVKLDENSGRISGYMFHSRDKDGQFGAKHSEKFVTAENIIPVIRPPWRPDQVREIPDLSPVIPSLSDIGEMNSYTLATAKWQSKILGFLKKLGGASNSGARGNTPSVGARQTFKYEWGEILEGFQGDDLEMKNSTVPNTTHIPYVKMQYAICAAAIGFPYEFLTLDLSQLDFSRQKGMLLLVNYACRPWKQWIADKFLTQLWNWRVAMEMRPGGELSPAPVDARGVSQWNKVKWQFPEEPWIDRQEASQSDTIEWQMGQGTMSKFAGRRGEDLEDLLRRKAEDMKLAAEIEDEYDLPEGSLIKAQIPGQAPQPTNDKPTDIKKDVANE